VTSPGPKLPSSYCLGINGRPALDELTFLREKLNPRKEAEAFRKTLLPVIKVPGLPAENLDVPVGLSSVRAGGL